jgi:hypothetical protein
MSEPTYARCEAIWLGLTGTVGVSDIDARVRETLGEGWRAVAWNDGLLAVGERPLLSVQEAWERAHALSRDPAIAQAVPHFSQPPAVDAGCGCSGPGGAGWSAVTTR